MDIEAIIVYGMIAVIVVVSLVSLIPERVERGRDVHVKVDWTYVEEDTWNLELRLDGDDIFYVDFVEYVLHPTFPNPIRKVTTPDFLLTLTSYGSFEVKALVYFKDEKKQYVKKNIQLFPRPFGWGTKTWEKQCVPS
jgi:hypothetical protein